MDLSILIPARNEMFLAQTVTNILENIEGDTEIIIVCDGNWPDPPIADHPRVTMVYHSKSIGQRAATNEAAKMSKAKFIMKVDAHCAFDTAFDTKLMKDFEYDWTIIPRMYNLHAFDWECQSCHNRTYQGPKPIKCEECKEAAEFERTIVWKPRRNCRSDFMRFDSDLHFQYWKEFGKRPEAQPIIAPTMSLLGACWMLHRERYWELDGMDEVHGSWGQMGTELACKSWLSGGKLLVNKNAWFSHLFRTQPGFGFPYPNPGISAARKRSRELWFNDAWPKAKYPLSWLLRKFAPIPGWEEEQIQNLENTTRIALTDVDVPEPPEQPIEATESFFESAAAGQDEAEESIYDPFAEQEPEPSEETPVEPEEFNAVPLEEFEAAEKENEAPRKISDITEEKPPELSLEERVALEEAAKAKEATAAQEPERAQEEPGEVAVEAPPEMIVAESIVAEAPPELGFEAVVVAAPLTDAELDADLLEDQSTVEHPEPDPSTIEHPEPACETTIITSPNTAKLTKGCVYYTNNKLDPTIAVAAQRQLDICREKHGLDLVSVSLEPMYFGKNFVLDGEPGYLTMFQQILKGLEESTADIIFLTEHDMLYHPCHFEFIPTQSEVFFYNENTWKVDAKSGQAVFYYTKQTSGCCAFRELLVKHYRKRVERVAREGFKRAMGFEPGCHKFPRGVDDYDAQRWMSETPNIDIRHDNNLTQSRWSKDQFRSQRSCQGWNLADEVPGWGTTKGKFHKFLASLANPHQQILI
jgi:hypothetical protein